MRRWSRLTGYAAAAFLAWGRLSAAQEYPIYELSDEDIAAIDLFDGSVDEWRARYPVPSLTEADFVPLPDVGTDPHADPNDLGLEVWLGWHAATGRIYLALEREDDVYLNDYPGDLFSYWQYDGIEFMVDGDHSGGDYHAFWESTTEEQTFLTHRTAQHYSALAESGDDRRLIHILFGDQWLASPPFGTAGGGSSGQDPTTSVIELYITPFDALVPESPERSAQSRLWPGKIVGFQVTVPDFDAASGEYDAFHTIQGQADVWRDADRFVDGLLLSDSVPPAGPPAPRLKVSFPSAGDLVRAGSTRSIHWFADAPVTEVRIDYSPDGGINWEPVTASTPNDGTYSWQVPEALTGEALIRISDAADGEPWDTTDGPFTVYAPSPDLDGNQVVDFDDFFILADTFGSDATLTELDGIPGIGFGDFFIFADNFGRNAQDCVIPYPPGPWPGSYANANASFTLGQSSFSWVGPDQELRIPVDAHGLVGVRQYDLLVELSPPEAFDLSQSRFETAGALSPGVEWPAAGQLLSGGWQLGDPLNGDVSLGQLVIRTSGTFNSEQPAFIRVARISVGPNSTERDLFSPGGLQVLVNPDLLGWYISRNHVLPGTVVEVHAQLRSSLPVSAVQYVARPAVGGEPVAVVSLADDGIPPDTYAGDNHFKSFWTAPAEVGDYTLELRVTRGDGEVQEYPGLLGITVAHTVLSMPFPLLVAPDQAQFRVPLFLEDDGQGQLGPGFSAATLKLEVWTSGPAPTEPPSLSFAGTPLAEAGFLIDRNAVLQPNGGSGSWQVQAALARTTAFQPAPAGEHRALLGYLEVPLWPSLPPHYDYPWPGYVSLVGPQVWLDENEGVINGGRWYTEVEVGRGDIDTSRAIDSFDASLVLMHTVGRLNLDNAYDPLNDATEASYGFALHSWAGYLADVTGQKGVTAFDASWILRRAVGMVSHFPAEEQYYRLWEPPAQWPLPAKPVAATGSSTSQRALSLGAVTVRPDGLVAVPILVDALDEVYAGTLTLGFDPSRFAVEGVAGTGAGSEYLFAHQVEGSQLRLSFAGAVSGAGPGSLAEIRLRPMQPGLAASPDLRVTQAEINEGNLAVRLLSSPMAIARLPVVVTLYPNYPNPFNPQTTLRYVLPDAGEARLVVYDLAGQQIRVLADGPQMAGEHAVAWDGADEEGRPVASGVFLCRLTTGGTELVRRMVLVR